MKFLVVADLHYSLKQYDWLSDVCDQFDALVLAGDLLDISSTVDLDTQILVVLKYLRTYRLKVPLLVASGNHDLNARNDVDEFAAVWLRKAGRIGAVIDGEGYDAPGARFTICPWWDGDKTFERVVEQLEEDSRSRSGKWYWIYHAPPDKTPLSWTGKVFLGDERLAALIDRFRPDAVFCGHVHQAPFRDGGSWVEQLGETVVFNAGRQLGAPPSFIAFDSQANTAVWYSQMANERIHLERPGEKTELG